MKNKLNEKNRSEQNAYHTSQGITLVALVITIIVLLILAGVAINMAVNSDGLFAKANEAVEGWNSAVGEEENSIRNLLEYADEMKSQKEDASGANIPKVPSGNIKVEYVTYTENTVEGVKTYTENLSQTKPELWHNYNEKQWANIKTTSKTANDDGTYNEAYWVWIPRYAYKVPARPTSTSNSGAPTFEIAFLKGTSNDPVDSTVLNGATIKTDTSAGVNAGDWVVHPAFTFGDQQLSGIWVAKYEASSNAPNTVANGGGNTTTYQVEVKPSVTSWRSIIASNIFTVCRNMTDETGALEGATTADPHMMKNVEWGAVTYLAQSIYGKNGQVWNNPYCQSISTAWNDTSVSVSDNTVILTGKVAKTAGANASNTTDCDSYNEGNGPEGSTTGNVYGVYDMAGGSSEYVAAYLNSDAQNNTLIASLKTAASSEETAKYVDVYTASTEDTEQKNYEANATKYGDAVYETSYQGTSNTSWQNDENYFPYSGASVFTRGGYGTISQVGTNAGVFTFNHFGGYPVNYYSFRPVCVAL